MSEETDFSYCNITVKVFENINLLMNVYLLGVEPLH